MKLKTDVTFGNACDIEISELDGETVVSFAADPHGGPECLWFCFRLECDSAPCKVRLVLKNTRNMLGGQDAAGMLPVIRHAGADWKRIDPGEAVALPDGRSNTTWTIDCPGDHCDVALCYPYGTEEIDSLAAELAPRWNRDVIGVSQAARQIVRMSNAFGEEGSDRPGIYCLGRQHSGETPGSWVLDGFLRRMADIGDDAPLIWAVPLANIDGVVQGDYGKDNYPYDLNRGWGTAMRHETLVMQRDMLAWAKRCRPVAGLNFHAPGGTESAGAYGFVTKPADGEEVHASAMKLAGHLYEAVGPDLSRDTFGRVAQYPSRWETPTFTSFCATELAIPAMGLETPYALCGTHVMTRTLYRKVGASIADGACAFIASV